MRINWSIEDQPFAIAAGRLGKFAILHGENTIAPFVRCVKLSM